MKQEINYNETTVLKLEDKAVKTRDEVWTELKKELVALVYLAPELRSAIPLLVATLSEFVHWAHDASGTHFTPSDLLGERLAEQSLDNVASSDETPKGKKETND